MSLVRIVAANWNLRPRAKVRPGSPVLFLSARPTATFIQLSDDVRFWPLAGMLSGQSGLDVGNQFYDDPADFS